MPPPYSPAAVANEFLDRAGKDRRPLTPMQLLKLTYIAHGWHLAATSIPLINEHVEAWKYGPVVPSLFHEFKMYGGNPIQRLAHDIQNISLDEASELEDISSPFIPKEDNNTIQIIDWVWKTYGGLTGRQLSDLTHKPDTPWSVVQRERGNLSLCRDAQIPNESIKSHYIKLWADRNGR